MDHLQQIRPCSCAPSTRPRRRWVCLGGAAATLAFAFADLACTSGGSGLYGSSASQLQSTLTDGDGALRTPLGTNPHYWMFPNQIGSEPWQHTVPGNVPYNGHLAESFSHFEYWPSLSARLAADQAGFGIFASEIGFMTDAQLLAFRQAAPKGIAVVVELPGTNQCLDGDVIAQAELSGDDPQGLYPGAFQETAADLAQRHNPINNPQDPTVGGGWLVSLDGHGFTPDQLNFDERFPGSLPWYNYDGSYRSTGWADCASKFNPGVDLVTGLVNDYVEYARAIEAHFDPAPRIGLQWSVTPNWEYTDPACMQQLHNEDEYEDLSYPCYSGVRVLQQVLAAMCTNPDGTRVPAPTCPSVVNMDMDYVTRDTGANTAYALEFVRRAQPVLASYGVALGFDVVDQNLQGQDTPGMDTEGYAVNQTSNDLSLVSKLPDVGDNGVQLVSNINLNDQETLLNVADFFMKANFMTPSSPLTIESWQQMPIETGSQVSEQTPGSFASSTLRLLNEYFANPARSGTEVPPNSPVYRLYSASNQEHLDSVADDEGTTTGGFALEGMEFRGFIAAANLVPFYRCRSPKHFLSLDPDCEGTAADADRTDGPPGGGAVPWPASPFLLASIPSSPPMGYLATDSSIPGVQPLYRLYNAMTDDHIVSFDANEGNGVGYAFEYTMGYALPPD